jgi:hypothetical protein
MFFPMLFPLTLLGLAATVSGGDGREGAVAFGGVGATDASSATVADLIRAFGVESEHVDDASLHDLQAGRLMVNFDANVDIDAVFESLDDLKRVARRLGLDLVLFKGGHRMMSSDKRDYFSMIWYVTPTRFV